jgi:hypothetical protein
MSGQWPPEWDSSAEEFSAEPFAEETLGMPTEAQLAEVSAFLATVPDPVLPLAVEARISAAIARETQSSGTRSVPVVVEPSALSRKTGWRRLRSGRVFAPAAAAACLVLAVAGYFASTVASPSGQAPAASTAEGSSSAAASAGPAQPFSEAGGTAWSGMSRPAAVAEPSASASSPSSVSFVVAQSGTAYQPATLATQASTEAGRYSSTAYGSTSTSAPSAARAVSASPSARLRGCVYHFTGASAPRLVDRGTYGGRPAYVIVGASKVWVVALGCTASSPDLLASAALTG